eukprot:gene2482-1549_t
MLLLTLQWSSAIHSHLKESKLSTDTKNTGIKEMPKNSDMKECFPSAEQLKTDPVPPQLDLLARVEDGASLGINGFSISATTLEEIFIKIAEADEEEQEEEFKFLVARMDESPKRPASSTGGAIDARVSPAELDHPGINNLHTQTRTRLLARVEDGASLGINGFSISATTLEEIFIKIAEADEEEQEEDAKIGSRIHEWCKRFFFDVCFLGFVSISCKCLEFKFFLDDFLGLIVVRNMWTSLSYCPFPEMRIVLF